MVPSPRPPSFQPQPTSPPGGGGEAEVLRSTSRKEAVKFLADWGPTSELGEDETSRHRSSLGRPRETNGRARGDKGVEEADAAGRGAAAAKGVSAAGGVVAAGLGVNADGGLEERRASGGEEADESNILHNIFIFYLF
jgi:hypothetical protein